MSLENEFNVAIYVHRRKELNCHTVCTSLKYQDSKNMVVFHPTIKNCYENYQDRHFN